MSKTIEIKKVTLRNLILSLVIGFTILFCLEHFGQFSYIANTPNEYDDLGRIKTIVNVKSDTEVNAIYYDTFFGNKVTTGGNGFNIYDLSFKDSEFKKYSSKLYYIIEAFKLDINYGFYFSIGIFAIFIFFSNFKIKLS